jgi:tetratricopeptide (TPR) repeat protein
MKHQGARTSVVLFAILEVAILGFFVRAASAQGESDDAYKSERKQAIELYNQNKHLDALPLFEDLAKRDPKDRQVLVGLGACLVDKSATMDDQEAAAKERIRARELLLKAQEMGDNSNLVQNLLQIIPADGVIKYSESPADQELRAGEAAFARRDFDEAIKHYSKLLELQPDNYAAALFIGDSYFAAKKFADAGTWYGRASQIDPNRETAYRYYADMLTKNGDMTVARTKAIQAVVAEPYNAITWRGLKQWADANKLQLTPVHVKVPDTTSQGDNTQININVDPNQSSDSMAVWLVYSGTRINWRKEEFQKHYPGEKQYRHSLAEETEALSVAASVLAGDSKKKKKSAVPKDPDLALLLRLSEAKMLEPYVLVSAADAGIAHDYEAYRQQNRAKLEEYLSEFVVPPAPAK